MSMIKKLYSMDAYPTTHLKYVMDSEWDILQALQTLMKKLTVLCDATVSNTGWNTSKAMIKVLKKQTTNESSIETCASDGDSDIVTSGNTDKQSS